MPTWETVRHQVAIAGRVSDAQTGKTIARARVEITAAPAEFTAWLAIRAKQHQEHWETMDERPDRTRTALDGHFHFLDLPDGSYTLTVSLPGSGSRYGTAQVVATVSRDAEENIVMAAADTTLPPTTVKGQITEQDSDPVILVAMAEVRVKGSGERTFSDGQGQYLLAGLETGARTVLVSAQGYQPASQAVSLNQAGVEQTLNFALSEPVV
ncbi:MAG: carboxypeptidase regulatory-like domain-containing protein [Anaerolineae bacterium]|jgi:hypothetical protein